MKLLYIIALILLLLGTVVGELIVKDSGYVLIQYQLTSIETSIWGLVFLVVISFVLFYIGLRFISYALARRKKIQEWSEKRSRVRANRRTLRGLLALSSGEWSKAHWLLIDAAEKAETPLLNYLAAARAAHEQGSSDACDDYLQQARKAMPKAEMAIGITQAQIQLDRGQIEPCIATLRALRSMTPKHTHVLKMLQQIYQQQQDWQSLAELLPHLKRYSVLKSNQIQELEHLAYMGLMNTALTELPVETSDQSRQQTLSNTWKSLPKDAIKDSNLAATYATLLDSTGASDQAETLLRDAIKREWNEELVKLYGHIASSSPAKQLKVAESWKPRYPDSATVLLTLGRLSLLNTQWEQAREYFEQSLEIEKSQETYNELARLLHRMEDTEGCQKLMKESLESITGNLPKLPLPLASED